MSLEINSVDYNVSITRQEPKLNISSSVAYVGSQTFIFNMATPSSEWTITHNLGSFPAVSVVDSAGTVVFGEVTYDSQSQVTVRYSSGFAGKAYLN